MLKKTYIQPALEILPFGTMVALCVSGDEIQDGLGGGNSGNNPWTGAHSPRNPVF
jgi:hypothetical protein